MPSDFYTDPKPTEGAWCVVMALLRKEWFDKKEKRTFVTLDAITLQCQYRGGSFYGTQSNNPLFERVNKKGERVYDQIKWIYHPTELFNTNTDPEHETICSGFEPNSA